MDLFQVKKQIDTNDKVYIDGPYVSIITKKIYFVGKVYIDGP